LRKERTGKWDERTVLLQVSLSPCLFVTPLTNSPLAVYMVVD